MPSKPKSLEQLKKHWYAKLAATGFEDIEDSKGRLKLTTNTHMRFISDGADRREEYYRLARQSLSEQPLNAYKRAFPYDKRHHRSPGFFKSIWKYHVEGYPYQAIAAQMNLGIHHVRYVVETLQVSFNLKQPKQKRAFSSYENKSKTGPTY